MGVKSLGNAIATFRYKFGNTAEPPSGGGGGGGADPFSASGGTETQYTIGSDSYKSHTFTSTGPNNFVVNSGTAIVDYLLVAGGGGTGTSPQGSNREAGSGAGGMITGTTIVSPGPYPLSLGAGGTGGLAGNPQNGQNTTGFSATAIGGGGGGHSDPAPTAGGSPGGSGGGGWYQNSSAGGTGTVGQGNNGSPGFGSPEYGGGGGGAGGAGGRRSGGPGLANTYRYGPTNPQTYAAGGESNDYPGTNRTADGTTNTGNGGNGRGSGGPGIIVIRYKT
jgi:hypothetical protein